MKPQISLYLTVGMLIGLTQLLAPGRAACSQGNDSPGPTKAVLFEAQALDKEGRHEEAAAAIRDHLKQHPEQDGFALRFQLGLSLEEGNLAEAAIEQYRRALEFDSGQSDAWLRMASLCYQTEQYDSAGRAFEKGFDGSDSPDPRILYYAGVSYLLGGEGALAFTVLSRIVPGGQDSTDLEVCRAYISAAAAAGRLEECTRVMRGVVSKNPNDLGLWRLLYQTAGTKGDFRQAAIVLSIIDYLQPLEPGELLQLGDLYLAINAPERSLSYYRRALADTSGVEILERLASAYVAAQEEDKARTLLERTVRSTPTYRIWSLLGDLNYTGERYEEALQAYRACTELDPTHGRPFLMAAHCAVELDRLREARNHAEKATGFVETRDAARKLLNSLGELP